MFEILDFASPLFAFSLGVWFNDALNELTRYFGTMSVHQMGIMSACACAFGFLCLKGPGIIK